MKSSRFACGVIVAFIFVAAALNGCGTKNEQPTMPISYTVHGTVLEQGTDTPISEASVIIDHMGMLTDAEGHFDAMGMSSGTHTVHATKEGYDTYSGEFQVSAAPESRQLSITMKRSVPPEQYRDVTINVHSQSNAESVPIANAIVTIADRADTTDQQGNAHLTQVPFGTQQMRIERYGLVLKEQPIDVDSETPDTVPIAVETTGDEGIELLVQTTQLSASLNRLNDPNVTPLTNMTPDQFAHEAIAGAREASNGLANIVKLENIDATVWKLENGRVIRVSNAARAAALGFKIVDYLLDGTDSFSGAVKIRATDGTITYFVQPNGGPMISAGSRLNDDERRRLLADNYGAPRVTNSLDELHQTIDGVIEVTNDACAIYSLLVIFTDGTTLPLAVTACSVSGKIQLVDAVWHVVDTFMNDYHDVGLYVRKPNFDGDPTVPLICITPIPNPNPPPFDRLFIHPELVITKLGHPAIQFQAVAHDESGNYSDVTDIVTWSMEDLTGQLVHGLFTPWQTGTGRIVITLDIAPQLNAHADVTVYPEQATCSFVVVFPELNHPGTYDITCHIGDLIPEFLQNIKLAYGDGSSDTIPPSELNYLSDFTRTHTYTANGTYQLVLNVTDVDGGTCESTHNLDVTIPANVPPVSHPDCPGTGRINVPIPVTNNATDSDGTVTSYRFRTESADFTQNEKTVNITFGSPGSKLVYMSAQDNDGDWGTEAYCTIEVGTESPTADFTFVPSDPHTDETITFTATVSDDDTPAADLQVRWQWETNSSWTDWSTTKTTSHAYSTAGTKHVTVEVKDQWDLTGTSSHDVVVVSVNHAPTASITPCPLSGHTNTLTCAEFGYADADSDPMADGELDWGDGTVEHYGADGSFCHTYLTTGSYTITWRVKDSHDAWSDPVQCTVTISQSNHPPVASITNCPGSGQTNVQVCAEFGYSDQDGDSMTDGELDWGDGTVEHYGEGSFCHTYTTAGTYTISWRVKDTHDAWSEYVYCTTTIEVPPNHTPTASINPCPLTGQANTTTCAEFDYADQDGDTMADGELNWGDGTIEQHSAPGSFCHTYTTAGAYTISWKVKDSRGAWSDLVQCTATISQENHTPVATIANCSGSGYVNTPFCAEFDYADQDGDTMADGELNWGDGTLEHYGAAGSYCHTYHGAATYSIAWRVKDSHGAWSPYVYCIVTINQQSNRPPVATIVGCPYQSLSNPTVCLEFDYSDPDGDAFADSRLEWGDGTNWNGYGPGSYCHTYSANGTYTVNWKVMDSHGAWSSWASCTFTIGGIGGHPPEARLECPDDGSILYGTWIGCDYYDQDGDPMDYGAIDWADGSSIQYVYAPGYYVHYYARTGWYDIRYTVHNQRDGWSPTNICHVFVNY